MGLYDIDIKELTDNVVISSDNEVSGSGIFDTLMVTVSKHIEAQYREGRILGTEYSTVYLGALQAVLELSTKILLDKDLIAKQAEEIDSRIAVNNKQIEKLTSDIAISEVQSAKELELKDAQIDKLESEITNDTARTTADVALKGSQKLLVDQQKLTEVQNTLLVTARTATEGSNKLLIDEQISKVSYEVDSLLPSQKSLIDKQVLSEVEKTKLIKNQTYGFKADATVKSAKLYSDAWSIMYSISPEPETMMANLTTNTASALSSAMSITNSFPA